MSPKKKINGTVKTKEKVLYIELSNHAGTHKLHDIVYTCRSVDVHSHRFT